MPSPTSGARSGLISSKSEADAKRALAGAASPAKKVNDPTSKATVPSLKATAAKASAPLPHR